MQPNPAAFDAARLVNLVRGMGGDKICGTHEVPACASYRPRRVVDCCNTIGQHLAKVHMRLRYRVGGRLSCATCRVMLANHQRQTAKLVRGVGCCSEEDRIVVEAGA